MEIFLDGGDTISGASSLGFLTRSHFLWQKFALGWWQRPVVGLDESLANMLLTPSWVQFEDGRGAMEPGPSEWAATLRAHASGVPDLNSK